MEIKKELIRLIIALLVLFPIALHGQEQGGEMPDEITTGSPPVEQPLVPEGVFAVGLVEALKIGQAATEAQAEDMLGAIGIEPRNGWMADYPVTPDIIGEIEKSVAAAAEAGRLEMGKEQALAAVADLVGRLGLNVTPGASSQSAHQPAPGGQYAEAQPSNNYSTNNYSANPNPGVINNYYYYAGPPVVTYYAPPGPYYYLYAWVPYPFWGSGFWFPGFFVLHDFDNIIVINHRHHRFTNHFFHRRWRRTVTIDPTRRGTERPFRAASDHPRIRGYSSPEARTSASSIFERSRERTRTGSTVMVRPDRGSNDRGPSSRPISNTPALRGRSTDQTRSPTSERRMSRPPAESSLGGSGAPRSPRDMPGRTYTPPPNIDRRSGMNSPRPSSGEIRSFSPPVQGSPRSFNTPSLGGGASLGMPQSGGRSGGSGHRF